MRKTVRWRESCPRGIALLDGREPKSISPGGAFTGAMTAPTITWDAALSRGTATCCPGWWGIPDRCCCVNADRSHAVKGAVTGEAVRHNNSAAKERATNVKGSSRMPGFRDCYQEQRQAGGDADRVFMAENTTATSGGDRARTNKNGTNVSSAPLSETNL